MSNITYLMILKKISFLRTYIICYYFITYVLYGHGEKHDHVNYLQKRCTNIAAKKNETMR